MACLTDKKWLAACVLRVPSSVCLWIWCLGWLLSNGSPSFAGQIQFNRDIRPILSNNCFQCHGPDQGTREAGLRLDLRESAMAKAIVPGRPDESELVRRIFAESELDIMPPPETHKKLTTNQKELLRKWIDQGAEYEEHWAYITPERPVVPAVEMEQWVRNPIDAFILKELEEEGIKPSREADKRILLRRLSLDLTGLPPTWEEMSGFLIDNGVDAYERQVERLLSSPHFGERMAVSWLDVARFADTVGYHGDQNQNIFPYRDYVINAFNQNKPFDVFTIEQLAGDLLPNPTTEQLVASGFNRLNMMTREGGAQPEEYLAKYAADRVRTVSSAWMGSTMACAECHDHKFDPFSAKDFYQLAAFFSDIRQWGVYADYHYTPNPDLRGVGNDHPFPPEIEVESPALKRRLGVLRERIGDLHAQAAEKMKMEEQGLEEWIEFSHRFVRQWPSGWKAPEVEPAVAPRKPGSTVETEFEVGRDRAVLFKGKPGDTLQLRLSMEPGWLSLIRLELLPHSEHQGSIVRGGGNQTTISLVATLNRRGKETRLAFHHAEADRKEERYSHGAPIIGVKDAWRTSRDAHQQPHSAVYMLDKPLKLESEDILQVSLGGSAVGCARISVSPFAAGSLLGLEPAQEMVQALQINPSSRTCEQQDRVNRLYLASSAWAPGLHARFKEIHREILECRDGRALTMVTQSWEPRTTRVLPRGDWQDQSGEIVEPAVPHFLPQWENGGEGRLNRLDLARWLVAAENPLTARTFVNRLWKQFYGKGLSAVLDDLGLQGEWPSHPELLDWLAVEFIESGWDVKHLARLMVTSSTYRQSSSLRPELRERDPDNRLLASQNPRRLEAEFVRDNALFIAGLINLELGGPSARPYQPGGYYSNLQFPDRDYHPHLDERQYRRGVYMHWQRTFLHPMLANFDAPSREECVADRGLSNTPQQALTLLNDPTFFEAARVFAQQLLGKEELDDVQRVESAFQKTLGRAPQSRELESLTGLLQRQRSHYAGNQEEAVKLAKVGLAPAPENVEPAELAAWTSVCRVILNLHETIMIY
jgi:hypothetical protein